MKEQLTAAKVFSAMSGTYVARREPRLGLYDNPSVRHAA
jgi:hypothetical protein